MTIYEKDINRPGITKMGPEFEEGICEPYNRTVRVERLTNFQWFVKNFNILTLESLMDVLDDEIFVTEYSWNGEIKRSEEVVGDQINRDRLTRRFFIYKSEG